MQCQQWDKLNVSWELRHSCGHQEGIEIRQLDFDASLFGRKRGIFVLVANAIAEDNSAINSFIHDQSSHEITEERVRMNLQLLAGLDTVSAYPLVRRIGLADVKDALTKGVKDFFPTLDLLAQPLLLVPLSITFAIICIRLIRTDLPLLFPLMSGFALVGPFVAICLLRGEPTPGARS